MGCTQSNSSTIGKISPTVSSIGSGIKNAADAHVFSISMPFIGHITKGFMASRRFSSIEKRVSLLQETPFFQYLTPETINEFALCFTQSVRGIPGKTLKLDLNKIYLVCEGEVHLSTTFPEEGTKIETKGYLCRKRRGDIIDVGQTKQDVLLRMNIRSNKMKGHAEDIVPAVGSNVDVLLLCADMNALDKFNKAHPELSKPIMEICSVPIEDRLLTVPFLREISKSKLSVLAAMCRYEAFESNRVVFEQDSVADKLFLVLSGVAQVIAKPEQVVDVAPSSTHKSPQLEQAMTLRRTLECSRSEMRFSQIERERRNEPLVIAELKSGDYFGETALVFNIDRTCGVRTIEKCLFLTVHKTDFENFIKICPIKETLTRVIKQRMVGKLTSLRIPFMAGIPETLMSKLADSVSINEVPKDYVIFKQGDVGDRFYIIIHGSVKVDAKPPAESEFIADGAVEPTVMENHLGMLGPGQYFGEMSLVSTAFHTRSATVTSTQKSILVSTDKQSFLQLFGPYSDILAEFELRILKCSATLTQVLGHPLGVVSFREFLEGEHAGENIDFWVAARDFRNRCSLDESLEQRTERAKQIYVTFCAEFADRQVNIAGTMLTKIENRLYKDNVVVPDLFDAAMQEVFRMMEKDKFARYKKTAIFKSFMSQLGILSPPTGGGKLETCRQSISEEDSLSAVSK